MSDIANELEPRRRPQQARSRERIESILRCSAELICEAGVEAVTTSEIARRAEISLASLYRYYPNKAAIVKALAEEHIRRLDSYLKDVLENFDLETGFDRLVDGYAQFYREEPGYKQIWSGVESMPELQQLDVKELYDNATVISEKAAVLFPNVERDRMWLICVMLPRVCGSILRLTMNMDESESEAMLKELKLMVKTYLQFAVLHPAAAQ
ncbi:MAG: TetR/AcrR family transcriptional regulator [Hahellaceae bacterium]|nr:TetR/AcrR family transcriptional regulator [Hahellaceae bacterium]MCP5211997.1 TetR/AcrR family transcriptional regulator [Hahellaceae bacterium]